MHDYEESVTTRQTDRQTKGQTDTGQSDPYVPLCFAGDAKVHIPGMRISKLYIFWLKTLAL